MSHGHVTPNEDGSRVSCGGPGACLVCKQELAAVEEERTRVAREREDAEVAFSRTESASALGRVAVQKPAPGSLAESRTQTRDEDE